MTGGELFTLALLDKAIKLSILWLAHHHVRVFTTGRVPKPIAKEGS